MPPIPTAPAGRLRSPAASRSCSMTTISPLVSPPRARWPRSPPGRRGLTTSGESLPGRRPPSSPRSHSASCPWNRLSPPGSQPSVSTASERWPTSPPPTCSASSDRWAWISGIRCGVGTEGRSGAPGMGSASRIRPGGWGSASSSRGAPATWRRCASPSTAPLWTWAIGCATTAAGRRRSSWSASWRMPSRRDCGSPRSSSREAAPSSGRWPWSCSPAWPSRRRSRRFAWRSRDCGRGQGARSTSGGVAMPPARRSAESPRGCAPASARPRCGVQS